MPSMKLFAETFFERFGGQITSQEDELIVDLPPELAAVFGKPRLYLVFPGGEQRLLSPTEDLLVYGSRTFEKMLNLLEGRGELTHFCLPIGFSESPGHPPPLPLDNCHLLNNRLQMQTDLFYIINFRVVYTSDEKLAEFLTLVVDAAGEVCSERVAALIQSELFPTPAGGTAIQPQQLSRVLARAGEIARDRANARAAELEIALRARLQKALLRLSTFYEHLQQEATGEAEQVEALQAELRQDLTRKLADELERHRLYVTISPMSCAVAQLPVAHYQLTLATRYSQHSLELKRNLYNGEIEPLCCHHCQEPLDHLALCNRGHAVHGRCLEHCGRCDREICLACGIKTCAICAGSVCAGCTARCAYDEDWLCAAHVQTCAICGVDHCERHRFSCRWCGQFYCYRCGQAGVCQTCRQARAAAGGTPPGLAVPGLKFDNYLWQQAQNKAFKVYIGQSKQSLLSALLGRPVIVTDLKGRLVARRRAGPLEFLASLFKG